MSGASCSSAGPPQVVKVNRKLLAACMTCPLCQELLVDATTISECLHTFCRKCIYQKLIDEELISCPVCFTHLGCAPLDKLRTDNNLQEMRSKIFPFKRRKVEAPEMVPPISFPIRRKERSLSSLVVNTPRVPSRNALTGRRTRGRGRKAVALRGFDTQIPIKTEEDLHDCPETSNLPEILKILSQDTCQGDEVAANNPELQKPLEGFVEETNFTDKSSIAKTELVNLSETDENDIQRGRLKDHLQKSQNSNDQEPVKKSRRGRKKAAASKEPEREKEPSPIWLSLVSAPDRVGDALLPQLSASYLRIKDSSLPVLLVQKYLAKKLELSSETEVEIFCRGQEVMPCLEIHKLADIWLQTESSNKAVAFTGSPAENFVMVLTYARKVNAATV